MKINQVSSWNLVYKREVDAIMKWLKKNRLDFDAIIMTKPEYEKHERRKTDASIIIIGDGNPFVRVLNSTEPLDAFEEIESRFLILLDRMFGPNAHYELINHYTVGIYE